jgi:ribose transport system ATP-binding protein
VTAVLRIDELTKIFPGQVALDGIDLEIKAGSTHALVGQNGSGKSTLIKVLCGYHEPTGASSATYFDASTGTDSESATGGKPLALGDGAAAAAAGIRFVHQDLGLVDGLSGAENIALGAGYLRRGGGRVDWKANSERARVALAELGFDDINVDIPVMMLAPSQKTAVAIARALIGWEDNASLLVLDEPTASLPGADVEHLFAAVRRLQERGVAILYVSHHLDEVFEIADEVTIFRDGKRVDTLAIDELNHDRLIELMVGHSVERKGQVPRADDADTVPALTVTNLVGGTVQGVDVTVAPGEIVGIAGITGSGREMLSPLITGQIPSDDGQVIVGETHLPNYAPRAGLRAGLAFLSADRSTLGIIPTQSVRTNLTLADLRRHWKGGRISKASELAETGDWVSKLAVKTAGTEVPISVLSGGNQQKVLFGRSLRLSPSVLVLDEPTRGIDVGAKEEIHTLIDSAAADGAAVLVASTDTEELVRLAHRVLVFRNGVIADELRGDRLNSTDIERAQLQIPTEVEA